MTSPKTQFAKSLRKNMTDAERCLWKHLRAHRLGSAKFKRQQPIGPYIVDFVCFDARLVIEIDGGQHLNNEADRVRDAWLSTHGFRVLRFWNNEVLNETVAVLERIAEYFSVSPLPLPSPSRGEGSDCRDRAGRCSLTLSSPSREKGPDRRDHAGPCSLTLPSPSRGDGPDCRDRAERCSLTLSYPSWGEELEEDESQRPR